MVEPVETSTPRVVEPVETITPRVVEPVETTTPRVVEPVETTSSTKEHRLPISPHAEPFHSPPRPAADGRRVGVLLCHGFTGSPAAMVPWGHALAEQGYGVVVPRLPGHGTTWQEMNKTRWPDWHAEVDRGFRELQDSCDRVVVGGLSLGGALALSLAAEHDRAVSGLVLVNPAVHTDRKDVLALPVLKHLIPSFPGIANDIKKPGVDEHGYDRTPLRAADSMISGWKAVRADLPRVTQPILLFRSAVDHLVDPSSARIILTGVSSRDVTERVLADSYHVATLDNDAPTIYEESAAFVRRVTSP